MRCDSCSETGLIHYRVSTRADRAWRMVCPKCWALVQLQPGYRYGGTRKANRRLRKR